MRKNGVLTYLHGDHPSAALGNLLGSTVLETNASGAVTSDEKYLAYGKQRDSGKVVTDHRFTGHPSATLRNRKEDASGLQYFNARFYDPAIGTFVSPDTLVTSPADSLSYNRYLYARANPLLYNDPSWHNISSPTSHLIRKSGYQRCKPFLTHIGLTSIRVLGFIM